MQARQARSKQSAKASNARRQPGKQRTRATSKAPHVPFLSFPHPLFQIAPTALDERERGPSPTILGIRIQEAQDTAMIICYIVFVLAKNCWFLANLYKHKLVGMEIPKILPLYRKKITWSPYRLNFFGHITRTL